MGNPLESNDEVLKDLFGNSSASVLSLEEERMGQKGEGSDVPYEELPNKYKRFFKNKSNQEIISTYLKLASEDVKGSDIVYLTALETEVSEKRVEEAVRKWGLKEEAKVQRRQIVEELFKEKVPLVKEIIGLCLHKVAEYVRDLDVKSLSVSEVKDLSTIALNNNNMLRLELGQSTHNVEVVQHIEKNVNVILNDLQDIDPFKTYPKKAIVSIEVEKKDE